MVIETFPQLASHMDVWIFDAARGQSTPLTHTLEVEYAPFWFPDKKSVLFRRFTQEGMRVFSKGIETTDVEREVCEGFGDQLSRSGRFLMLRPAWQSRTNLAYLSLAGTNRTAIPFPEKLQGMNDAQWSPDDSLLAYDSNETRRREVYVITFPAFANKTQVSRDGGHYVNWRPDGSELFYLTLDDRTLMSVPVKGDSPLTFGEPVKVFDVPEGVKLASPSYDVTRDGQRFVMVQTVKTNSSVSSVTKPSAILVENWSEEFREAAGKNGATKR